MACDREEIQKVLLAALNALEVWERSDIRYIDETGEWQKHDDAMYELSNAMMKIDEETYDKFGIEVIRKNKNGKVKYKHIGHPVHHTIR